MTPGRHANYLRDLWCWLPHAHDCHSLREEDSRSSKDREATETDCDCGRHGWLSRLDGLHRDLTDMHIIDCIREDLREQYKDRDVGHRIGDMGMGGKAP